MSFCIRKYMFHSQVFLWEGQLAFQHPVDIFSISFGLNIGASFEILVRQNGVIFGKIGFYCIFMWQFQNIGAAAAVLPHLELRHWFREYRLGLKDLKLMFKTRSIFQLKTILETVFSRSSSRPKMAIDWVPNQSSIHWRIRNWKRTNSQKNTRNPRSIGCQVCLQSKMEKFPFNCLKKVTKFKDWDGIYHLVSRLVPWHPSNGHWFETNLSSIMY